MKNSAELGGFYPLRPLASVDNTLLDLQNSSYPTQPHSIIANYIAGIYKALYRFTVIKVKLLIITTTKLILLMILKKH